MKRQSMTMTASAMLLTLGVCLAGTAMASSYDRETTDPRVWHMPAEPEALSHYQAIDSQPRTRQIAERRMVDRLGYTANQVARADRQHVSFEPGSASIPDTVIESLTRLAQHAEPMDQIVVTGYAGAEIAPPKAQTLAQERAETVAKLLEKANPRLFVQRDATYHWGGSNANARRVEIFIIRALNG